MKVPKKVKSEALDKWRGGLSVIDNPDPSTNPVVHDVWDERPMYEPEDAHLRKAVLPVDRYFYGWWSLMGSTADALCVHFGVKVSDCNGCPLRVNEWHLCHPAWYKLEELVGSIEKPADFVGFARRARPHVVDMIAAIEAVEED